MSEDSDLLRKLEKIRKDSRHSESDSDEFDKDKQWKEENTTFTMDNADKVDDSVDGVKTETDVKIQGVKFEEPDVTKSSIPRDIFYVNDNTGCLQTFKSFDELSKYLVEASSSNVKQDDPENDDEIISTVLSVPLGSMVHHVTMGKYLRHLYEKDRLMDVNVEVGSEVFRAHRIALACYSKYFADLFLSSKADKYPINVKIKGISEKAFATFLEFVYTGEAEITQDIATDFLVMAEYLKCPGLRKKYEAIVDTLPLKSLIKILLRNKDGRAFRIALERTILNFKSISEEESLLDIDTDLLRFLLESDHLHVDSEYEVFLFIIKWIAHDLEERTKYAFRLLSLVRFTCMTQEELFLCSETTGLVRGYDKFREYLLTANWVICADLLKREDHFGFKRDVPRNSYKDRLVLIEGIQKKYAKKEEKTAPMPPPLLTSSPKYAKPVMVPPDMQSVSDPKPIAVDILVVGGFQVEPNAKDKPGKSVEKYDIEDNQWVYYSNIAEPRRHHAVVTLAGKLYLIGGCQPEDETTPTNTVFEMDIPTKNWTQITAMNEARMQHCACVLNGKIYVIGGLGPDKRVLDTVESYNPDTNSWSSVAPIPFGVYAATAAVLRGQIFVAGGITSSIEPFAKQDISPCVTSFDPLKNAWEHHNDMRFPRCRAEMVNVGDRLFVCGGAILTCTRNTSRLISLSSIDEYVEKHDMWCHLTDLIIPRHDIGIAVAGDRIYIVGGVSTTADRVLQSIECFDTQRNSWLSGVQDLPYPSQWLKCATVVSKWQQGKGNQK